MKTILITGATSGIGYEAAIELAKSGAKVVIVGRSAEKTARCLAEIRAASQSKLVESLLCDFESQASIRAMAAEFLAKYDRLDVLVNNAGTVYDKRKLTVDGIEATFATNHLGYFLLTHLLLDRIRESAPARIVVVASIGHRQAVLDFDDLQLEKKYSIMPAYRVSKLGNVMFTRELARRLEGTGVTVNSLHPGAVATGIWDHAPAWAQPILYIPRKLFFITAKQGAETILQAVNDPALATVTGAYLENKKVVPASPLAQDDAAAARMWEVSARMTGLSV